MISCSRRSRARSLIQRCNNRTERRKGTVVEVTITGTKPMVTATTTSADASASLSIRRAPPRRLVRGGLSPPRVVLPTGPAAASAPMTALFGAATPDEIASVTGSGCG